MLTYSKLPQSTKGVEEMHPIVTHALKRDKLIEKTYLSPKIKRLLEIIHTSRILCSETLLIMKKVYSRKTFFP